MNRVVAREIVGCLGASSTPGEHLACLAASGCRDWEDTLEWLDHSGIALLFWNRLKELGKERAVPAAIGERLERNLADHRIRVARMVEEFDSINRCLEKANVKYAVLKGFALIPEYCPDIFLRTTYDYDYLVDPESLDCAECALRAAGFLRKEGAEDHPIVYFQNPHGPPSPLGRSDLYSAALPRTFEMHYRFWDATPVKIPLALRVDPLLGVRLRGPSSLGSLPGLSIERPVHFYVLAEEDELIFQVLHVFRHILRNWCRLCSLLDIAHFLKHRAPDIAFWDRFLDRLKYSRPLSEIAGVVFLLTAAVFGAAIPAPVSAQTILNMRRSLVLWVERYGQDSALGNFSDNKFGLFLHHEFIQDDATWRAIQRSCLFPIHRPNRTAHTSDPTLSSGWAARLRQWSYVGRRLKHHLVTTLQYRLESPRWDRARSRVG